MSRSSLRVLPVVAVLALAACSEDPNQPIAVPTPLLGVSGQQQDDAVVPGEVIVKVKDGADIAAVSRKHGKKIKSHAARGGFDVLEVAKGSERAEAAKLASDPSVEYAEPNYLRQLHTIDSRLWAFYNPGGMNAYFSDPADSRYGQPLGASYSSIADADEDNVEGYAAGGSPVVVGSIDTGADFNHSELSGNVIAGKDWVNNDNDPTDDDDHGTHTTGTMIGRTVGIAGVSGAGSNVKAYVQKVCSPAGCPTTAIVNAIYAAADYPGMVAMNLSLGGGRESQSEKNAIKYAVITKGVLVIASAGNSGAGTVACPACDVNAISVSATTWRDGLAYYTQYGNGLDISAPGGELYSNTTEEMGILSAKRGGGLMYMQGTSMAAPQVTGTAGIVASKTGLRGSALRTRLQSTADDKGTAGYDTKYGNGRLNSYRAVTGVSLPAGQ